MIEVTIKKCIEIIIHKLLQELKKCMATSIIKTQMFILFFVGLLKKWEINKEKFLT